MKISHRGISNEKLAMKTIINIARSENCNNHEILLKGKIIVSSLVVHQSVDWFIAATTFYQFFLSSWTVPVPPTSAHLIARVVPVRFTFFFCYKFHRRFSLNIVNTTMVSNCLLYNFLSAHLFTSL